MSLMLPRYFGMPPEIFEMDIVQQMTDSALRLYIFLWRTSDKKSNRQFKVTDAEIDAQAKVSTRALRDARQNLLVLGLIQLDKVRGGGYTYTLCDVVTKRPFPGDPRAKPRYTKKEKPAPQKSSPPESNDPPQSIDRSWAKSSERPAEDTSFNFGHNAESTLAPCSYSPF